MKSEKDITEESISHKVTEEINPTLKVRLPRFRLN
jgi:hypothetical protein